jgi:hypothetical protein
MSEVEQSAAEERDFAHGWPREIRQNAVFHTCETNLMSGSVRYAPDPARTGPRRVDNRRVAAVAPSPDHRLSDPPRALSVWEAVIGRP